jgi:RNA polymerase sigma-70 factor, ECF subfamily
MSQLGLLSGLNDMPGNRAHDENTLGAAGAPDPLGTFTEHRHLLFSIAYRMMGTVADAEDVLQDAFIRWQQSFRDDIRSPKAFLVTTVSRLCINQLQSARAQREEYVGQWLPEPIVTDSASDPTSGVWANESISMAFLVLMERLNPVERAVFLLREVFEYDYVDISTAVGRSEANCRQILRRAKDHVQAARPRFASSAAEHGGLLTRFIQAATTGDLEGLVALLATGAVLHTDGGGKAPALPNLIHGSANIARAILGGMAKFAPKSFVTRLAEINGEPGFVSYLNGKPAIALVLHIADDEIQAIFAISNPSKLEHLPDAPS